MSKFRTVLDIQKYCAAAYLVPSLIEGHFKICFREGYNHLLCQPLKIRNQGFSNTLCVQVESRAFNVNENYNSDPLCINILPEE